MNLRDHFGIIWRRKWVVVAVAVLVAVAVYFWFARQPKVYQAQAELSVAPGQVATGLGAAESDAVFLAATYSQLATTSPVIEAAIRSAGLNVDEPTAASRLSVGASSSLGYISVTARGPSLTAATALAKGEVDALSDAVTAQQEASLAAQLSKVGTQINQISGQLNIQAPVAPTQQTLLRAQLQALEQVVANLQSRPLNQVNLVAPPRAATTPVSPRPKTDALLGLVTALVVNAELAVLLEAMSDRFPAGRLEEEVTRFTDLPVLAHVPKGDQAGVVEACHKLRTSLIFMSVAKRFRTVAIVGTEPGAGKSFISVNLALATAELGLSVVIVDGDMRRPVIHQRLATPRSPGLSEVLRGTDEKEGLYPLVSQPGLRVMPAGGEWPDPSGLLAGKLADAVLLPLVNGESETDLVVLDTPPEALFPDAVTIAAQCDGTIVVVDARKGRRKSLRRTLDQLRQVGARPVGVVLNRSTQADSRGYRYGSYGGRGSHRRTKGAVDR